jgi:toxin ParE1/3/4
MQTFNIKIDIIAELEILEYFEFIAADIIQAANLWISRLYEAIQTLETNPERCPLAIENAFHDFELRHLIYGNYRIIFRIKEDIVQILHIRHSKLKTQSI